MIKHRAIAVSVSEERQSSSSLSSTVRATISCRVVRGGTLYELLRTRPTTFFAIATCCIGSLPEDLVAFGKEKFATAFLDIKASLI